MKMQVLNSDMQLIAEREIPKRTRCHVSSTRLGRTADNITSVSKSVVVNSANL